MYRRLLTIAPVCALAASITTSAFAQPSSTMKTDYAPVNGLQVYYEVHGQGKPMILLHGGITATEGLMGNIEALAKTRQVIALHAQGHGHTADIDRPYRFESLADDVAAGVKHLKLPKVDVVGYSFGGGIALQTAIRHPDLVDRLVVIAAGMKSGAFYPEVMTAFEQMSRDAAALAASVKASPLATMYPKTNWEASFRKVGELSRVTYEWTEQVEGIRAPPLLIFADADAIRLDHIAAFYHALGGGRRDAGHDGSLRASAQLAIVPGATHRDLIGNPALGSIVEAFLSQKSAR